MNFSFLVIIAASPPIHASGEPCRARKSSVAFSCACIPLTRFLYSLPKQDILKNKNNEYAPSQRHASPEYRLILGEGYSHCRVLRISEPRQHPTSASFRSGRCAARHIFSLKSRIRNVGLATRCTPLTFFY